MIRAAFLDKLKNAKLLLSPVQLNVVNQLQLLDDRLRSYHAAFLSRPCRIRPSNISWSACPSLTIEDSNSTRGVYMYGSPGCGKSMLMDLFFEHSCVPSCHRQRVHFHAFMLDIHDRLHHMRQSNAQLLSSDPLPIIASSLISDKGYLWCFDEFQVNDVADAMILRHLFQSLFNHGAVCVFTSNIMPSNLYSGGINRDVFLPFIHVLTQHCDTIEIKDKQDYRSRNQLDQHMFFYPLNETTQTKMDVLWNNIRDHNRSGDFEPNSESKEWSMDIKVMAGRTLHVPKVTRVFFPASDISILACRFPFRSLCGVAIGPSDYLALAKNFSVVMIDDIPQLTIKNQNQTRRFINLIDILYDNHTIVLSSADTSPSHLLSDEFNSTAKITLLPMPHASISMSGVGGASGRSSTFVPNASGPGLVEWSATGIKGASMLDSLVPASQQLHDERFAAERTVSRLREMHTESYVKEHHPYVFELIRRST